MNGTARPTGLTRFWREGAGTALFSALAVALFAGAGGLGSSVAAADPASNMPGSSLVPDPSVTPVLPTDGGDVVGQPDTIFPTEGDLSDPTDSVTPGSDPSDPSTPSDPDPLGPGDGEDPDGDGTDGPGDGDGDGDGTDGPGDGDGDGDGTDGPGDGDGDGDGGNGENPGGGDNGGNPGGGNGGTGPVNDTVDAVEDTVDSVVPGSGNVVDQVDDALDPVTEPVDDIVKDVTGPILPSLPGGNDVTDVLPGGTGGGVLGIGKAEDLVEEASAVVEDVSGGLTDVVRTTSGLLGFFSSFSLF